MAKQLIREIKEYIYYPFQYFIGKKVYKELSKKGWLIVFNHAIGETVFTCEYIQSIKEFYKINKCVVVTKQRLAKVIDLFNDIDETIVLDKKYISCLCAYLRGKDKVRYKAINSIWSDPRQRRIADSSHRYNQQDPRRLQYIYTDFFGIPRNSNLIRPKLKEFSKIDCTIIEQLKEFTPEYKKIVIFNPFANTCKMLSNDFWRRLKIALEKKGYFILINGYQFKKDFGDANCIMPELDDAPSIVDHCHSCISIQSGFSDLLVESGCNVKVVFVRNKGDTNEYRNTNKGIPFEVPEMYIIENDGKAAEEKAISDILSKY